MMDRCILITLVLESGSFQVPSKHKAIFFAIIDSSDVMGLCWTYILSVSE